MSALLSVVADSKHPPTTTLNHPALPQHPHTEATTFVKSPIPNVAANYAHSPTLLDPPYPFSQTSYYSSQPTI